MAVKDYDKRIRRLEHQAELKSYRAKKPETPEETKMENARFLANTLSYGLMLKEKIDAGGQLTDEEQVEFERAQWVAQMIKDSKEPSANR